MLFKLSLVCQVQRIIRNPQINTRKERKPGSLASSDRGQRDSNLLSGKISLNLGDVDLIETTEAAIETARQPSQAKSQTLQLQNNSKINQVRGDRDRLQQIAKGICCPMPLNLRLHKVIFRSRFILHWATKNWQAACKILAIALTAYAEEAHQERAFAAGFHWRK